MKLLLILLLFVATAHARIDETPEEIARRYGPVIQSEVVPIRVFPDFKTDSHQKNGFRIFVHYLKGRVDWLRIYKEAGDQKLSANELAVLMAANAHGGAWVEAAESKSGKLGEMAIFACHGISAKYSFDPDTPAFLEFMTKDRINLFMLELTMRRQIAQMKEIDALREF